MAKQKHERQPIFSKPETTSDHAVGIWFLAGMLGILSIGVGVEAANDALKAANSSSVTAELELSAHQKTILDNQDQNWRSDASWEGEVAIGGVAAAMIIGFVARRMQTAEAPVPSDAIAAGSQ